MPTQQSTFIQDQQLRVGVTTLGCKVNAFESQLIAQGLKETGWRVVDATEVADLYIVNTCTVTQEADRQARQAVRRAVKCNPDATVVVTGCYAQMDPETCAAIPGVDLVLGNDRKLDLAELLPALRGKSLPSVLVGDLDQHVSLPQQLLTGYEGHTRAFVQVQQGCDQSCTFCIIHRARGPSRSLSPVLIKQQVRRLLDHGYREIVICGVDLGAFGADWQYVDNYGLADLLTEILALESDFRVRLSSLDPAHIDSGLVELFAQHATDSSKLCPHLHLSLQSGNTLILKRMKRRYTAESVYRRIESLRQVVPDLVLSADIMVGFPTETDDQFADTEQMVRDLEVVFPHVFPFSARRGTPAARIPAAKHVPVPVRKARAARLRQLGGTLRTELMARRVGRQARVLLEDGGDPPSGMRRARAADYLPVWVPQGGPLGAWLDVEYTQVGDTALIARPLT